VASFASLLAIGSWDAAVGTMQSTALAVGMDVIGMTGEQACSQYMRFGTQSAGAMTTKAPKMRPVERLIVMGKELPFVTLYPKGQQPTRLFKHQTESKKRGAKTRVDGWRLARVIRHAGLASRMWACLPGRMGGKGTSGAIRSAYKFMTINQPMAAGYIYQNKLDYITKKGVMPADWDRQVEMKVGNRIMGRARDKLMDQWRKRVGANKGAKIPNEDLARFFTAG